MTRCPEFYDKYEKDGNFCGLSPSAITQIKAYNEMRETIGKHIPDRALIVENFPEYAARAITNCAKDDETKTKALNYVVACLKRGEKVTHSDLKKTIQGWLKPGSCTVENKGGNVGHVSKKFTYVNSPTEENPDPANSSEIPNSSPVAPASEFVTGTQIRDGAAPDPAQDPHTLSAQMAGAVPPVPAAHNPPPCKGGGGCTRGKFKVDKVRGNICDAIGAPINQLPGNMCPYDAKLERQVPAATSKPLQDRTLTITFPPDEWEVLKNVQRAGEADGFEAAVHVIIQRAGGA